MKKYNAINQSYFSYVTHSTINTSTQTPTATVTNIDKDTNFNKIDNKVNNDSIDTKDIITRDVNMLDSKNNLKDTYIINEMNYDDCEWDSDELNSSYLFSPNKYLINSKLELLLDKVYSIELEKFKVNNISYLGIYLVAFRVIKKGDKDIIVYNTVYYNDLFTYPLMSFLYFRYKMNERRYYNGFNNSLFIIDPLTGNEYLSTTGNKCLTILIDNLNEEFNKSTIKSTYDCFRFLSKSSNMLLADKVKMYRLLELAINRDLKTFLNEATNNLVPWINSILYENDINNQKYNIINRCIFITKHLDTMLDDLRSKGLNVNAGPQKHRGFINSASSSLALLDSDFRYSLYTHNNYHASQNKYYSNNSPNYIKKLTQNKFSYNNIHMRLGLSKYYSTNTKTNKQIKSKDFLLNSIFKNINIFLEENPLNTDTQKKIESFVFDQYNKWESVKPSTKFLGIDMNIFTPKFSKLLTEKILLIKSYIKKAKLNKEFDIKSDNEHLSYDYYLHLIINRLDDNKIISLIMYYFCKLATYKDGEYENINTLNTTISFGKDISREYLISLYKEYLESNKNIEGSLTFSKWKNKNINIVQPVENDTLYAYLGARIFFDLLSTADLIHQDILQISKSEKESVLKLNIQISDFVEKNKLFVIPLKLPMIVEPKAHNIKELGGYLLNDIEITDELIIDKANYKESSTIKRKNIIYNMVNNLNKTSYKINNEVLEYILDFGVKYGIIIDNNIVHEYENIKRTKRQEKIYRSYKSKLILQNNILYIASAYANIPNIYFPVRLDQRGRVYCEPNYFNYQSTELAKSLISFAHPGIIKRKDYLAIEYLKAYGANCYGQTLDKKSYAKRVEWVDKNKEDILKYKNGKLISKAKDKCLFLAFCIEYTRFNEFIEQENTLEFKTYLPVQLDATCNGFQHLAMLSNETKIFQQVNLSKASIHDIPYDLYTYMKRKLLITFKEKSSIENLSKSLKESYNRLNNILLDRSHLKKAIMTLPYNASILSVARYIKDQLKKCEYTVEEIEEMKKKDGDKVIAWYGMSNQIEPKRLINDNDIILLAKTIYEIIYRDFPKIKKLSEYLFNVAKICDKLRIPISWSLPHGLHIHQSYLLTTSSKIKPFAYSESSLTLKVPVYHKDDKLKKNPLLSKNKQKISLMPNLIHSLDAASLALLYNSFYSNYKPIVNFYAIHDCFTTTCDRVDTLINYLKVVYMNLYTEDSYLRKFDKGIIDSIIFYYGEDCKYDSLNRTFTIDSKKYVLNDIEEVLGKNLPKNSLIKELKESKYLII